LPARSFTPPATSVAVYIADGESEALGCNVAVEPLPDTDAGTAVPLLSRKTKLLVVTLDGAIASLKVALTLVPTAAPVAPTAGTVLATVGGVVSGAPVVNDQE
jgi:hypothetical protein